MITIEGDILDITRGTIFHQVNCRGAVGGLAGALYSKYPRAFDPYFSAVNSIGTANFGSCILGYASPDLVICHVFGQIDPGPNTELRFVRMALDQSKSLPLYRPLYAPYLMGCGLGGGDWPEYLTALSEYFPELTIIRRKCD